MRTSHMISNAEYEALLSPFALNGHLLRNRIVLAPMSTQLAGWDGSVNDGMRAYYGERAQGGCSMIITETFHVDGIASRFTFNQPSLHHDRYIPGANRLAESIKEWGGVAIAQIGHAGRQTEHDINNHAPVAPSRIPGGLTQHCHELGTGEIEEIIGSFVSASRRAQTAGFDGVEIHSGNGYLLNEFISPLTNRRSDEYGRNRASLLTRLVEGIAESKPADHILGVRIGISDFYEGGLAIPEAFESYMKLPLEKIDYLHLSGGIAESDDFRIQPIYLNRGIHRNASQELKKRTAVPIILTGSVNDPSLAEEMVAKHEADLIGMGRPLLADPELPVKLLNGEADSVRPCIRCNQGCLNQVRLGNVVNCAVNPAVMPGRSHMNRSISGRRESKKRVLIAGAGPAGITAALRAEHLGLEVLLFEKEEEIGGMLKSARYEPFKRDISDYLSYLIKRVAASRVELRTSAEVDPAAIGAVKPDFFINATGSLPAYPDIPEKSLYPITGAREILSDPALLRSKNKNVVILGGGMVGCEIAYGMSRSGCRVTVVERLNSILCDCEPTSALALRRLLREYGVTILTGTSFLGFGNDGLLTTSSDNPLHADLAIVAMGSMPNGQLDGEIDTATWRFPGNYLTIGDAKKVGNIFDAVHGAYWGTTEWLSYNGIIYG